MHDTLNGESPQDGDAHTPLAETYLLIGPGLRLDDYDRGRWIAAKRAGAIFDDVALRGGAIFDDVALDYPRQRGFAAFDGPAVKWVFGRSDLIIIDPDRDHAYSLWNQHLAAGRKIALVATSPARCTGWYGHAVRWRGPKTTVCAWLPAAARKRALQEGARLEGAMPAGIEQ